jgi:hypothetical protein
LSESKKIAFIEKLKKEGIKTQEKLEALIDEYIRK